MGRQIGGDATLDYKIYHLRNSPNVLDSRQNRLEQINQAVSGGRVDRRGGGKSHFDISFLL